MKRSNVSNLQVVNNTPSLRVTRSNLGWAELDCRTAFAMTNKKPQIEW